MDISIWMDGSSYSDLDYDSFALNVFLVCHYADLDARVLYIVEVPGTFLHLVVW